MIINIIINKTSSLLKKRFKHLSTSEILTFYFLIYTILLFSLILLISYLSKKTILTPKYNTELNIGSIQNIKTLLPIEEKNTNEKILSSFVYSGLLRENNGEFVNDIAESVTFDDEYKHIKIKIRDDAKFSNGENITTEDIIWTYELAKNQNTDSIYTIALEGIDFEQIDTKNFNIILKNNYPEIKDILTLGIMDKESMIDIENDIYNIKNYYINNVYSGPYIITKVNNLKDNNNPDDKDINNIISFELEENNNYHKKPFIKYINFYSYHDINTIYKDFYDKKIDLIINNNSKSTETLMNISNENIKQRIINSDTFDYALPVNNSIFLNTNKISEFAKAENRKIIYDILNRENILKNINTLQAIPSYDIMPASKNTSIAEIYSESKKETFEANIDSTSSIDENKKGLENINFYIVDTENNKQIANNIKKSLENVAFLAKYNINIIPVSPIDINNNIIKNREFDILMYGIEIDNPSSLYLFLHSSQLYFPGLNITTLASPQRDSILQKIKNSKNKEEQIIYTNELREDFNKDYPFIPIYNHKKSILINNQSITNQNIFENIKKSNIIENNIITDYKSTEYIDTNKISDDNKNTDNIPIISNEKILFSNIINNYNNIQKVWPIFYNSKVEYTINKILH